MRYQFLSQDDVYEALNKIRAALLAAKTGEEVNSIINGLLTFDEQMKIGRRVLVAQMLMAEDKYEDIKKSLKVGNTTISLMMEKVAKFPECFKYIQEREEKVETEFKRKAYRKTGGSKLVFKKTIYTGFKRSKVKR